MGTKFTPGPWAVRGHNSELPQVWDNGFDVCITDRVFNGNAALIAAAPDLLAVVKMAANWFGELGNDDGAQGLLDDLRAAIAKAEGGA